jgi:hypothetical protein
MRYCDNERRHAGRPGPSARSAVDESLQEIAAPGAPHASAAREQLEARSLTEAQRAHVAREELAAGHARVLSLRDVERELNLPPV